MHNTNFNLKNDTWESLKEERDERETIPTMQELEEENNHFMIRTILAKTIRENNKNGIYKTDILKSELPKIIRDELFDKKYKLILSEDQKTITISWNPHSY